MTYVSYFKGSFTRPWLRVIMPCSRAYASLLKVHGHTEKDRFEVRDR